VRGRIIWLHTEGLVELVRGVAILAPQTKVVAVRRAAGRTPELSLDFRGNAEKNRASIICQFEIGAMSARFSIYSR
jgi:hypothetical protein